MSRQSRDDIEARRRLLVSLAVAVLVHGALLVVLLQVSRARRMAPVEQGPAIRLRLIDARAAEPAQAEPPAHAADTVPPAASARESVPHAPTPKRESGSHKPPEPSMATTAAPITRAPAPAEPTPSPMPPKPPLRVFNRDGSVNLPDAEGEAAAGDPAAFGRRARVPAYTPDPMAHRSPLPYEPTRFERDWTPQGESLLGEWVSRATVTKTWDTAGGTRITCSSFLFFGGCAWGPAPRVTIEELKRMRADPPMPRPSPLLPDEPVGN